MGQKKRFDHISGLPLEVLSFRKVTDGQWRVPIATTKF